MSRLASIAAYGSNVRRRRNRASNEPEYLVILASGQSNMAGRQTTALGGALISPDDDQHPRVYKYPVTPGPLSLVTMPIAFPDGATYDANVTPAFAYANLVAADNPSSKVVIIPAAYSGTGLHEWVAGQVRFDAMATALAAFLAANPDSSVHSVIVSNLEHEMANAIAPATVASRFDAMIAAHRALPGVADAPIYVAVPVPEYITAGGDAYRLVLLEGAKAAVRNSMVGIIGGVVGGGGLSGDSNLHYNNAANRTRGSKLFGQIAIAKALNSASAPAVTVHSLNGTTLTFTSVGAPYYDIQTSPVGAGTWTSNLWVPNQDNSAGQQFSLTLPGSGSRDYRIVSKAKSGDGISSIGTYTAAGASSLIARMSVTPDATRQGHITTLFNALSAILPKLDFFYIFAAHDRQAARLNWASTSYDATEVGGLTFTTDRGFAGNGTTGYLNTGFNPGTAGGQLAQNSAHLGIRSRTAAGLGIIDMGARIGASANQLSSQVRNASNVGNFRINVGVSPGTVAVADGSGHFISRRDGATSVATFRNGVSIQTYANASAAPPSQNIYIGSLNDNGAASTFSTREYSAAHAGGSLTDQEITDLTNAVNAYMTAVGA